jgi:hypothetical protein
MVNGRRRMKVSERLSWAILIIVGLGFVGHFLWHYDTWPLSLALVVAIIVKRVGNVNGGTTRHPQENDPNRR